MVLYVIRPLVFLLKHTGWHVPACMAKPEAELFRRKLANKVAAVQQVNFVQLGIVKNHFVLQVAVGKGVACKGCTNNIVFNRVSQALAG